MATTSITVAETPRLHALLARADDALVLGHRTSEWTGRAPTLEEELALANIALDLIGQANLLLGVVGDADTLAFRRDVLDFRNCWLVEQPNGDFARTMVRQLLFSTWQHLLYQRLATGSDQQLAGIAAKAVKEVAYHRELAAEWVVRLGDGTEESARRTADGLDWSRMSAPPGVQRPVRKVTEETWPSPMPRSEIRKRTPPAGASA